MEESLDELIARYRQELAVAKPLPVLRLHAVSRLPTLAFALLCGLIIFLVVLAPIPIMYPGDEFIPDLVGSALFFGCSVAVIAGCAQPVFVGAQGDLANLREVLEMPDEDLHPLSEMLTRCTRRGFLTATAFALAAGAVHIYLLGAYELPLIYAFSQSVGTLSIWLMMTWSVPFIVRNGRLFSRLGRNANPDLLRPSRQAGFGAAALRPALFIIAVLCAYPLLLISGGLRGATFIGVVASVVTLPLVIALPLRGIRQRINEKRAGILEDLDERLDRSTRGDLARASAEDLFEIDAVLDMRERVADAPGWPVDLAGVRRILLYIVLPPLTWVAAALVEMMIDGAL